MNTARLFAEIIKKGISNSSEIKRDLSMILNSIRSDNPDEANSLLKEVQALLNGNDPALTLLTEIAQLSQESGEKTFGPVLANSTAAIERLALLVSILFAWEKFGEKVKEFIDLSDTSTEIHILTLFNVAKDVTELLNSGVDRRTWQREVIPSLLQVSLKNSQLLLKFTVSATGGELPTEWSPIEIWLSKWDNFQSKSPDDTLDSDGFFTAFTDDYQPAALHPLELRILRTSILQEEAEVINTFSRWLINNVFDLDKRLPNIVPESAFAAGAFVLDMVRKNRLENGDSVKQKVINTIVLNSEETENTPQLWQGKRERIHELLNACPDWYESSTLIQLRQTAAVRFNEEFDKLKLIIPQKNQEIPNEFLPRAEFDASNSLKDFRPNTSIVNAIDPNIASDTPIDPDNNNFAQFVDSQWRAYITKIKETEINLVNVEEDERKVKEISQTTQQQIAQVQRLLKSPLAEPAFADSVFGQVFGDRAFTTYCHQRASQLFLENKISTDGELRFESLENQPAWVNTVNQTASDPNKTLQAWAQLETWDSWRGRLAKTDDDMAIGFNILKNLGPFLVQTLSSSNLDGVNLEDIRPKFAALSHLGVKHNSDLFKELVARLETWLVSGSLSDSQQSLLAATRLELGLTAISADIEPAIAFREFEQDRTALQKLAGWIVNTVQSENVWESRVGMNMLILSSRLAEETGDVWIETVLRTAITNASIAQTLVNESLNILLNGTGGQQISGLPLALAAFDLMRYARETARSIGIVQEPVWLSGENPLTKIDEIAQRFTTVNRQALASFAAEGGVAGKVLLLSIVQMKLDELQRQKQLIVTPIHRDSKRRQLINELQELQKTLRSVFCSEEVLLRGLPDTTNEEIIPWWQAQYWPSLSIQDPDIPKQVIPEIKPDVAFAQELEEKEFYESNFRDVLNASLLTNENEQLSESAIVRFQIPEKQWLILDREKAYLIEKETETSTNLTVSKVAAPFYLFNWSQAYHNNIESNLLSLAATLEASVPLISGEEEKDIDGKFEGEFPELSWKLARERLEKRIEELEASEITYKEAIETQLDADRNEEIIQLLKQPLLLNTADYREQIQVAIADLRTAEAELEVAEREALAAEFETFASELLYEATELEVERQSALEEISKLDKDIADLNSVAVKIQKRQAETDEEIANKNVDLALNFLERSKIQKQKAERARAAILQEIKLLKKLLGTAPDDPEFENVQVSVPDREEKANGQIAAMAIKIEDSLISQLTTALDNAEKELNTAKDKERERKRKAKRRRWIKAACSFVGAVVGGVLGGPGGVTLGAQIGGAVGELTNGIIEDKPPEEILIGLIDNGFAIAQAAGVNLEQELNTLGAKGSAEIKQFLTEIESNLEPVLDSLPNILDEQLFKDAIEILDLEEVPQLRELLNTSYKELKVDLDNLNNLGSSIKSLFIDKNGESKAIGVGDSRELLKQLSKQLFTKSEKNFNQFEALASALGEEIEDIATNKKRQEEILGKVGKLVITQIGQEAGEYQRQIVSAWIHQKRELGETWDAVREEGELLLQELFSDSNIRTEVQSNMEISLLDPTVIQGKIQSLLEPWQAELDKRLKEITEFNPNPTPPKTAVQAAQQRVDYLKGSIEQFNEKLIPWLKGESNLERAELFKELDAKLRENADAADDVVITELEVEAARTNIAQAESALQKAQQELERVGKLYQIAEIKVSRASLQSKVVRLSKLQSEKRKDAQGNSLKAAEQKYKAAQARIKAARFIIESRQAGVEAATLRGVEASKVRAVLSQPPLRLPKLAQSEIAQARLSHADNLTRAFKAYRELVRYAQAANVELTNLLPNNSSSVSSSQSWGKAFEEWLGKVQDIFDFQVSLSSADPIGWNLTPKQIQSLFTDEGFKVIIGPHVQENPILFSFTKNLENYLFDSIFYSELFVEDTSESLLQSLFSGKISSEWEDLLLTQGGIILQDNAFFISEVKDSIWHIIEGQTSKRLTIVRNNNKLTIFSRSLLLQEFDKQNINFSTNVKSEIDVNGPNWKITDFKEDFVAIDNTRFIWNIRNEPLSYTIEPKGDQWNVRRRQKPPELFRTSSSEIFYEEIDNPPARTGRMLGVFLSAKETGTENSWIGREDYTIEVEHLGDYWPEAKKVQLHSKKLLNTQIKESRIFWIKDSDDPETEFSDRYDTLDIEGDPNPYNSQGIPLSGTTIIRLKPIGEKQFNSLKLRILYKYLNK